MKKEEMKAIINKLLTEMEEEDIGISLFSNFYQNQDDLKFFKEADRNHVLKILKKLSEDSKHHKDFLTKIITHLGQKCHEE